MATVAALESCNGDAGELEPCNGTWTAGTIARGCCNGDDDDPGKLHWQWRRAGTVPWDATTATKPITTSCFERRQAGGAAVLLVDEPVVRWCPWRRLVALAAAFPCASLRFCMKNKAVAWVQSRGGRSHGWEKSHRTVVMRSTEAGAGQPGPSTDHI